jgi:hypothetical protein
LVALRRWNSARWVACVGCNWEGLIHVIERASRARKRGSPLALARFEPCSRRFVQPPGTKPEEPIWRISRASQCARVDSDHHGPYSPQGPQPYRRPEYASAGVQIVRFVGIPGRMGRIERTDLGQRWVTARLSPPCVSRLARLLSHSVLGWGWGCDRLCTGRGYPSKGGLCPWLTASDSMFSVRVISWHGFGVVLDRPPANVAEAIEAAGLGLERASAIQALRSSGTNRSGPSRPLRPTEGSLMCGIRPALAAS